MPNHKSAEKRDRQNARRNAINVANRSQLRSQVKKLRAALDEGNKDGALKLLPQTVSEIDKAVQKGVLHKNAAARQKARLTARLNKMEAK